MSDEEGEGPLSTLQKLFLHSLISKKILTDAAAKKMHKKSCALLKVAYRAQDLPTILDEINNVLDKLGFAIRRGSDPTSGKAYIMFTNSKSDPIAQLATDYNPIEVAYFRTIVEDIMTADDMKFYISHKEALTAASNVTPVIKKLAAQKLLASFTDKGWLVKSEKGNYSLSLRALNELESYLEGAFPDETEHGCVICQGLVTVGYACPTQNCPAHLHKFCLFDYRKSKAVCPSCQQVWPATTGLLPIGEDQNRRATTSTNRQGASGFAVASEAESSDDETPAKARKKAAASKKRKQATRKETSEQEDEEEEEAEIDELATPAPSQSQGSRSRSRTAPRGGKAPRKSVGAAPSKRKSRMADVQEDDESSDLEQTLQDLTRQRDDMSE